MKIKKIILGLATIGIVVVSASMIAAFEAHVINVTAKIENALEVPIDHITFGTVFPQEELEQNLSIKLSQSFLDEDRVDDVEYIIRQKPKCGWTINNGTELLPLPTMTGHITADGVAECPDAPTDANQPSEATWGQLPLLCSYLSKHKVDIDDNQSEVEIDAFHKPWQIDSSSGALVYNEAKGRLAKSDNDLEDDWNIDLKVPCFGDYCAQDWDKFVTDINPNANPDDFVQDIANEHKVFGCDLWIEVNEVSETNDEDDCLNKADIMLVLDRSGSVGSNLTLLQDAAKDFANELLVPLTSDALMGQSSFAQTGSLDQELTDNYSLLETSINGLSSTGRTNLSEGIILASTELASLRDRDDLTSKDYMVVITDGEPNEPDSSEISGRAAATTAAIAARAAGTKIFVIGVGTDADTAQYLSDNIANHSGQYYDVANYAGLKTILSDIASCQQ